MTNYALPGISGFEDMLTILDLARQAVMASQEEPGGSGLTVEAVFRFLDSEGSVNEHLRNPLNDLLQYYIEPREIPLSGQERVFGTYLALTYRRHDQSVRLHSFDTLELLEEFLASSAGWVHPFITCCVAFVEGKREPYRIGYSAAGGSTELFDKAVGSDRFRSPALRASQRWTVWHSARLTSHRRWQQREWGRGSR
jgi:hypothetical protein